MRLTKVQQKCFDKMLLLSWVSAYELQASLQTLNALYTRGLIEKLASAITWCPRVNILWRKKQ